MAKKICLYQQTTTLHVHQAILYISLPSSHHYSMKLPNFTNLFYGVHVGEHNTRGGGTWVIFGWVCAAQDPKLAPLSKEISPKIDTRFRNGPIFYTPF